MTATNAAWPTPGRVMDLSCEGMTALLDPGASAPTHLSLRLEGHRLNTPVGRVEVVHRRGPLAGLRMTGLDPVFLGQVGRILDILHRDAPAPGSQSRLFEAVDDRGYLNLVCLALAANRVLVEMRSPLGKLLGRTRLLRARCRRDRLEMSWDWGHAPAAQPCTLVFEGHNALYRLRVESAEQRAGLLVTTGPALLERLRQRRFPRVAPRQAIQARFEHPLIPGRVVHRQLWDLTYNGFSFRVDVCEDLLFHELEIPALELLLPDGSVVRARAHVCHNYMRRQQDGLLCGIQLDEVPAQQRRGWETLVQSYLLPSVARAGPDALAAMWEHYTRSGYFSLSGKSPLDFQDEEKKFTSGWRRINQTRGAGELSVFQHDGQVIGSLTTLRAYSGTLLIQGLATRGLDGQAAPGRWTISRDLYFTTFHRGLCDPTVRFVLAYLCMSSARRWHEVLCEGFARENPAWAEAHRFTLMEAAYPPEGDPLPAGLELADAGPEALHWLTSEALTPALRQALDYTPEHLDLGRTNAFLAPAAQGRRRRILAARRGGRLLALAVVEGGCEGLNPYNLLACVRVLAPDEQHPGFPEAAAALLAAARADLASQGHPRPVLFAGAAVRQAAQEAGFVDIDEGMCWTLHRDGFAAYLARIYEIISPN